MTDLDRAIALLQPLVAEASSDQIDRAGSRANLANALVDRYEATGQGEAIETALELCLRNAAEVPPTAPNHAKHLDALAYVYGKHFHYSGRLEDLNQAIDLGRKVLALDPAETAHPRVNLATSLLLRAERTGQVADFDESIVLLRRGLNAVPAGHSLWITILANLAGALRSRYSVTRRSEDLDEAIASMREAVVITETGSPELPWRLSTLGNGLADRFSLNANGDDLDAAIEAFRQALALMPTTAPGRLVLLSNAGMGLRDRYHGRGQEGDLEEAMRLFEEALALCSPHDPFRAKLLTNLASCCKDRHRRRGHSKDLEAAKSAYAQAIEVARTSAPAVVLIPAQAWCKWALERRCFDEASAAGMQGLAAVERLLASQMLQLHQEDWLAKARGLTNAVAYALAAAGDVQRAVVVLEAGRARFLSGALERGRSDLERLADLGYGELLERYRQASSVWASLASSASQPGQARQGGAPAVSRKQQIESARKALDAVIEEVRAVPGYEGFLGAPTFAQVEAAADAPLAYLVATAVGGAALIVTGPGYASGSPDVERVDLPLFTEEALVNTVFGAGGSGTLGGYLGAYVGCTPDNETSFQRWEDALDAATRWLWDVVMGPLVTALAPEARGKKDGPFRVVVIPTGLLGLLPLHAAWRADATAPLGRRYAIDDLELSYTPNARVLTAARVRLGEIARLGDDRLILVVEPSPVSAVPLPFAAEEALAVERAWPKAHRTSLLNNEATYEKVHALLPEHSVLHYAGHALAAWDDPERTGLVLAGDRILTVHEIRGMHLAMRLAVLSACETGVSGVRLPDEVVSLPAALVEAGVAGVVASLWAVPDAATATLMAHFSRLWRDSSQKLAPASALRLAQIAVRDGGDSSPSAWAAFSYTGA